MTKQEYVNSLVALYRLANLADSDSELRAEWMPAIYSRCHCNALFDILAPMLNKQQYDALMDGEPVIV